MIILINRLANILIKPQNKSQYDYSNLNLNQSLEEVFISSGIVDEVTLLKTLEEEFSIIKVDVSSKNISEDITSVLSKDDVKKYSAIPFDINGDKLCIAMSNPLDIDAIEDISFITNKKIFPYYDKKTNIYSAMENYYSKQITNEALEDLKNSSYIKKSKLKIISNFVQEAPIVKLTDSIINQAINKNASDIHLDPFRNGTIVRFRLDGILKEHIIIPKDIYPAVATRIKIKSNMDISKKMTPQDGKINYKYENRYLDLRTSSIPTLYGEKITIRILNKSNKNITIDNIIYDDIQRQELRSALNHHGGIILVTGPTARELERQQFTSIFQSRPYFFLRSPKKLISMSPVRLSQ